MSKLEVTSSARSTQGPHTSRAGEQVLMVQMAVSEVTGVALTELASTKRGDPETAFARQMAIYLCHLVFGMSAYRLADAFGRDRKTVRHALRRVEDLREDRELDRVLSWLEASLRRTGEKA